MRYQMPYLLFILTDILTGLPCKSQTPQADTKWPVVHCADFQVTGNGSSTAWNQASWLILNQHGDPLPYQTKLKIMYSDSGIYCLYHLEDKMIHATLQKDFLNLWTEDVVEAFFWPDTLFTVYFEYELSPLNHELPILVPNRNGDFLGWRPWNYTGKRLTRHAISIQHEAGNTDKITGWFAEFFIPYALLSPLVDKIPSKGTLWKANFYRIDYDQGQTEWYWQPVPGTFHDYKRFGKLEFK
jgi:hypothetical protein